MKRPIAILLAVVAPLLVLMSAPDAQAGPQTYSNSAYDLTQATPWDTSGGHCGSPCHIPLVNFTSHYAATMNTSAVMVHYWTPDVTGQQVVNPPFTPAVGQTVGVICWTTSTNWGVVDKIDARFAISGTTGLNPNIPAGSYLWIGYVDDDWVNLTYADRVNYVPRC